MDTKAGDEDSFSVYAVSDVHTDKKENMELIQTWPCRHRDVLLLAGDVSNDLQVLRSTFEVFLARFAHVFFCPGNHDLWLHHKDGCKDSIEKFWKIEELCKELGVRTRPGRVGEVLIVPLLSWYHASFDADPDICDDKLCPVEQVMTDFMACKWPEGLTSLDGSDSIARFMDGLNDERAVRVPPTGPVISFSHFLPRQELIPEKRLLYYPMLPKAAGSLMLGEQVRQLASDLHVFGHTHFGWCSDIEGTRYLQACLAYPRERAERPHSVYCRSQTGEEVSTPLMVYSHSSGDFADYRAFWSEYYKTYPRQPDDLAWIYREPRKKEDVAAAVKTLVVESHGVIRDAALQALL